MLALLALPIARREAPRALEIERALEALTADIAREEGTDEQLLGELTRLAARVESAAAASRFRFGAARFRPRRAARRSAPVARPA